MTIRKLSAVFVATVLLFSASLAQAADYKTKLTLHIAAASTTDEVYTLTVPDDFKITTSGWNEIGSIKATYTGEKSGGFTPNKKVVVTVTSTNSFVLKADGINDTVSYFVAAGENDTSETTTFEFSASEITKEGTSKTIGVNVEGYSDKKAGDYEDTLEYNAAIQDVPATPTTITVKWTASEITADAVVNQNTMTRDNVTLTAGSINTIQKNIMNGGTFTAALGKFTKIEATAHSVDTLSGDGWSVDGQTATWAGEAASSVSFSGNIENWSTGLLTIIFTIEL